MDEQQREEKIRRWFEMWLIQKDLEMENIFDPQLHYMESWGPEYHGLPVLQHWFWEWNARGKVLAWEIRQFFHRENQTVVEWYFHSQMKDGSEDEFDGVSLIEWTKEGKIRVLKEFGCNRSRYNPYENGSKPVFRDEKVLWF